MFETAQPQAEDSANQPDVISATESELEGHQNFLGCDEESGEAETPDETFMTVRYNKQDKPLSKEEAVTYAQKGMNYDKLQERLKETAAKLSKFEEGHSSAMEGEAPDKQAIVNSQLESFMRGNPGIDPRRLPEDVISKWKNGVPLSEAYLAHQTETLSSKIREMEKAAAQQEANRKNETASMGNAVGNAPTRGQISEDSIRNMTSEELEKNHDRIWAYLTGR